MLVIAGRCALSIAFWHDHVMVAIAVVVGVRVAFFGVVVAGEDRIHFFATFGDAH